MLGWPDPEGVMGCRVDGAVRAQQSVGLQVGEATCLDSLSYHEAWELSYFGASVLHPRTTMPARKFGIPIVIRNFFNQSAPGAWSYKLHWWLLQVLLGVVQLGLCSVAVLLKHRVKRSAEWDFARSCSMYMLRMYEG